MVVSETFWAFEVEKGREASDEKNKEKKICFLKTWAQHPKLERRDYEIPHSRNHPDNPKETRALRVKATHFVLLDGELYKRGFSQPLLKYLTPEEGNYVLREIHEEICGNHLGGRDLAGKVVKQGYFWLTMLQNAQEMEEKSKNGAKGWRSNSSSPQSAIRKQTIKPRSPIEQSPTLEDEVRVGQEDWVDEFPTHCGHTEQRQEPPLGISFYPLLGDGSRCTRQKSENSVGV
ncbi:hypothetical protein Sango_2752800 [Sesamum angolense]|uniref:Integrase zinc-binding domain-containing protein n=1 Tax=Sesamum angolense TaxID=2727404 RepID=A0AAE1VYP2_9LAMI|nr:hypothetical protein Sango_2752800 [Sesamum angolense]